MAMVELVDTQGLKLCEGYPRVGSNPTSRIYYSERKERSMNKEELTDLIETHVRSRSEHVGLLKLILGEFQSSEHSKSPRTIDQIVHKLIDSNHQCFAARPDEKYTKENDFLKTLLPNYMSVAELRDELSPLGLEKAGASIGKAVQYLKANGLSFLPADVKKAILED